MLAFLDQRADALQRYDQALALFRAVGDRLGEANVLKAQGDVRCTGQDYTAAQEQYQAALALYRQIGARQGEANTYLGLGRLALAQGQPAEARRLTQTALLHHAANGDRYGVALDSETLAQACAADNDWPAAAEAWRQAATNYRAIDQSERAASALTNLAKTLEKMEQPEQALAIYAECVELQPSAAWLRRDYANALVKHQRLAEAAAQLDAAEELEPAAAYLALRRAELAQAQNDPAAARRWAEEALRRRPEWDEAQAILNWANNPSAT